MTIAKTNRNVRLPNIAPHQQADSIAAIDGATGQHRARLNAPFPNPFQTMHRTRTIDTQHHVKLRVLAIPLDIGTPLAQRRRPMQITCVIANLVLAQLLELKPESATTADIQPAQAPIDFATYTKAQLTSTLLDRQYRCRVCHCHAFCVVVSTLIIKESPPNCAFDIRRRFETTSVFQFILRSGRTFSSPPSD